MTALQVTSLGPIIRGHDLVKDKAYQRSPVGKQVGRYLGALRYETGSTNTVESYESVLAYLAIDHDDFTGLEDFCSPVGTQYLRDFLSRRWGTAASSTRRHRVYVLHALFKWAVEEGICAYDPSRPIRPPRDKGRLREAHEQATVLQLVERQDGLRDACALGLMARLGLRKNELRLLQLRDVNLARGQVTVLHGKGGRSRVVPLEYASLRDDLEWHLRERALTEREVQPRAGVKSGPYGQRGGSHPRHVARVSRSASVPPDWTAEYLLHPRHDRTRPMEPSTMHRWFKRCLDRAGLPDFPMHELRHTAADDLWRRTRDLVAAQQLLGHSSVGTTQTYLHPTAEDLRASMRMADESWRA